MKTGGLYRRETPDAPAELVERTMSADEQEIQGGRPGSAPAVGDGSGSGGLVQDSEGSQDSAQLDAAADGSGTPQAPADQAEGSKPPASAPSTRTRKGG
jgi:hypothetical protein